MVKTKKTKPFNLIDILKLNRPEAGFMVGGVAMSAISGGLQAASSVLYTEIYNASGCFNYWAWVVALIKVFDLFNPFF